MNMNIITSFLSELTGSTIIKVVIIAIVMDTIFGVLRAIKQHKFNSCFGINGAIRKVAMIVSILCLALVDKVVSINLIGFIPNDVRLYFPENVQTIGIAEFFAVLYVSYEIVSILKNMALCGLPVKGIWSLVYKFLGKYTEELPDQDELEDCGGIVNEESN